MLKRSVAVLMVLLFLSLFLTSCGSDKKLCLKPDNTDCHTFVQYGLCNQEDRNPNIHYDIVGGNVVWGILLFETAVAPILLFGWYLYEPEGVGNPAIPGTAD